MSAAPATGIVLLLGAAMVYNFVNGFQDGPNIVSTMIASGAMGARGALAMAAACTLVGPLLFGHAVADMIGSGLVAAEALGDTAAISALLAASLWNLVTWWLGIPVSSSHALLGALAGAALAGGGWAALHPEGLATVGIALLVSPLLGFVAALAVMHGTRRALRNATPRANVALSRIQVATAAGLALANGANDVQKTAGVLALGLLLAGASREFAVPWWAMALAAVAIAAGTLAGGERVVRTLGGRFYRIRPIHGFSAQLAAAGVMGAASLAGGPVSATQVVSLAIVGSGAADRLSKVRWAALGDVAIAWAVTMPASALLACGLEMALAKVGG